MTSIDNIFNISEDSIKKANQRMIEYGEIKKENPQAYEFLIEKIKKNLKSKYGIEITKEDIIEANQQFIEKYNKSN